MSFIRNTDKLVEGLQNKWFTNVRAKSAVQSDLDQLASDISAEASARESAISGLQSQINNVLSNVDAGALDSLSEIVSAFQSADNNINTAISNLANSAGANLEAEESARISADNALDARLDVIEGSGEGSVAKAEQDAKDYTDLKIGDLEGNPDVATYVGQLASSVFGQISSEATARENADNALSGRLDILEADPVTKSYVDSADNALDGRLDILEQDPTTKAYVDGIQSALDGRLDVLEGADSVEGSVAKAEKDAKDYADGLDSAMDARVSVLEADPVTKTYVDGEVSDLQGQVNTEKGRIDAILLASEADKDSFAEIVSLINSIDTSNDSAFASYVLSNDAALAQEVSDRQSADNALDGRLDVIEGSGEGSVAKAEQDAKDYADGIVSAEESARISADNALDARLDILEADPTTKSYVDGLIGDLEGNPDVATFVGQLATSVSGQISSEATARENADNALDARLDVLEADPVTKAYVDGEISSVEGQISAEQSRAEGAESALSGRLDVLEADPVTKSYVDGIQSALDGRLDILEADPTTKTYVDGIQSALDGRLDILEADPTTKTYVDQKLGPVTSVSSNLSLSSQSVLLCNVSGGTVTLTLPQASSAGSQRRFVIKDSGSASNSSYVRIQCSNSEQIDGNSYYDIVAPYESVTVFTDGSNWYIV